MKYVSNYHQIINGHEVSLIISTNLLIDMKLVLIKLVTLVDSDPSVPFSIATTQMCMRGLNSISWIAPLYP